MKKIIILLVFFLHTSLLYSETFMTKSIHEDINLSKITIPEEKDIIAILEDDLESYNVVINYIKSLIYNSGQVSKEQEYTFKNVIANLTDFKKEKILEIVNKQLTRCNCKFNIIDFSGGDHYLPFKIIRAN